MKGVIAGAGYFAQFHADAWNRMPDVKISGVADPDNERAREFAARWNIPNVYESLETALEAERPDFIDIITRPDTHLALAKTAADRGVAVICQKPMAPTPAQCREMVDYCGRAGVRLIIHENWRWQPWYRQSRKVIDSGVLGTVFHIGFSIRTGDGRGEKPYTVQPYFVGMDRLLVHETLVHFLDTLRFLGGEIEELHCRLRRINPVIAGEDYAIISTRLQGGIEGLIDANRISGAGAPEVAFGSMRIEGDRGVLRMDPQGNLFLESYGEPERPIVFDSPRTGYKGDSVLATQQHIVGCLRSGRPAESEGHDYIKIIDVVEACYRSAEINASVRP